MKILRKFKIKPLTSLMLLSLLGFIFFACCVVLVIYYYDEIKNYLETKYEANLDNMKIFIVLAGIQSCAFLFTTLQLLIVKPTSLRVMMPVVIITISAFILLISIDFYIEYHLMHMTPKAQYTKSADRPTEEGGNKKKGKGFKMGFLIIYINMCLVTWLIYLAYKNLEEELDNEEYENEPMEITISHIT